MASWPYRFFLSLIKTGKNLFRGIFSTCGKISGFFRNTLGVKFYKINYSLKKKKELWRIGWPAKLKEKFGKRRTLQVVALLAGLTFSYPHSILIEKDRSILPGEKTLIVKLVSQNDPGLGEAEYEIIENTIIPSSDTETWNSGAIRPSDLGMSGESPDSITNRLLENGYTGLAAGGSAIIKPSLIGTASSSLPSISGESVVAVGARKEPFVYTVTAGDVLGSIASRFGLKIETLLNANGLTQRSVIRPGQELVILPTDGIIHRVKRGETVGRIAGIYRADQADIIAYNALGQNASLKIDQILIIPGGTAPKPATIARPTSDTVPTPLRPIAAPPASSAEPSESGYIWPTTVRRITVYFGKYYVYGIHTGLDIAGPKGTPVFAAKDGRVITAKCTKTGYGCHIIIDHEDGSQTLYAHHSEHYVDVGEYVSQGQTISAIGSTGRSTGPHLHFEVKVGGVRKNPLNYIR